MVRNEHYNNHRGSGDNRCNSLAYREIHSYGCNYQAHPGDCDHYSSGHMAAPDLWDTWILRVCEDKMNYLCPQHHIPFVSRVCWICKGETPKEDCRLCKGKGVAIVCPNSNIPYELVGEKWEILHLEDELV